MVTSIFSWLNMVKFYCLVVEYNAKSKGLMFVSKPISLMIESSSFPNAHHVIFFGWINIKNDPHVLSQIILNPAFGWISRRPPSVSLASNGHQLCRGIAAEALPGIDLNQQSWRTKKNWCYILIYTFYRQPQEDTKLILSYLSLFQ